MHVYIISRVDGMLQTPIALQRTFKACMKYLSSNKQQNQPYIIRKYKIDDNGSLTFQRTFIVVNDKIQQFNYENV